MIERTSFLFTTMSCSRSQRRTDPHHAVGATRPLVDVGDERSDQQPADLPVARHVVLELVEDDRETPTTWHGARSLKPRLLRPSATWHRLLG